jgi:hypothetical protein
MGLIKCISLIEERAISCGLEQPILLGLDRVFSLGLDHSKFFRFEVQFVDVGLALATALDREQAVGLKRF